MVLEVLVVEEPLGTPGVLELLLLEAVPVEAVSVEPVLVVVVLVVGEPVVVPVLVAVDVVVVLSTAQPPAAPAEQRSGATHDSDGTLPDARSTES